MLRVGLCVAIVIVAISWTIVRNSGRQEARHAARGAVLQLKTGLDQGAGIEQLRTFTDAIQIEYARKPGAFDDCGSAFRDLQTHITTIQSYSWSESYRKTGFSDLNADCDVLLDRLK
jgi:hypothetical protein